MKGSVCLGVNVALLVDDQEVDVTGGIIVQADRDVIEVVQLHFEL